MADRELTIAEEQGWRSFWDGWIICPSCKEEHLRIHNSRSDRYPDGWGVPPNYGCPGIGVASLEYDQGCIDCAAKPPLELTWRTQQVNGNERERKGG